MKRACCTLFAVLMLCMCSCSRNANHPVPVQESIVPSTNATDTIRSTALSTARSTVSNTARSTVRSTEENYETLYFVDEGAYGCFYAEYNESRFGFKIALPVGVRIEEKGNVDTIESMGLSFELVDGEPMEIMNDIVDRMSEKYMIITPHEDEQGCFKDGIFKYGNDGNRETIHIYVVPTQGNSNLVCILKAGEQQKYIAPVSSACLSSIVPYGTLKSLNYIDGREPSYLETFE